MRELNELALKYKDGTLNHKETLKFYKRSKKVIYNFIWKKTQSEHICKEISEETVFKAFYKFDSYNPTFCFSTWLHTIAINAYNALYKQQKKYPLYHFTEIGLDAGAGMNRSISEETYIRSYSLAEFDTPHVILENKEKQEIQNTLFDRIHTTVNEMNETHKFAFINYLNGYLYEDVSIETGIPKNTLKTRVRATKKKLSKSFTPMYDILNEY